MKKRTRYMIAALFLFSLVTFFMDVLKISVVKVQMYDILNICIDDNRNLGTLKELAYYIKDYVGFLALMIAILMLLIVIAGFWVLSTDLKRPHDLVIALAVIYSIWEFCIVAGIKDKLDTVTEGLSFWGMKELIQFEFLPLFLWIVIYAAIILLTVLDKRDSKVIVERNSNIPIMPEEFFEHRNPWVNRQPFTGIEREGVQKEYAELANDLPKKLLQQFYGAIIGRNGVHNQKVFLLPEMEQIFIDGRDQSIEISNHKSSLTVASIYFVDEYQEYCICPSNMMQVFLESGQPLGMNRDYYLPRGTKIYFQNRKKLYELA